MSNEAQVVLVNSESSFEEKYHSEWQLNNVTHMKTPICTPVFSPIMGIDAKFVFQIWYKNFELKEESDISYLHVTLKKLPGPPVPEYLLLYLYVSVNYLDGKIYQKYTKYPLYVSNLSSHVCILTANSFADMQKPCSPLQSPLQDVLAKHPCLILKCYMRFSNHLLPTVTYHRNNKSLNNLLSFAEEFKEMYQSDTFSDVIIQIGEKTIKSHKFVLASHSPVFKRMLEHDFMDSKTRIKVSHVDYDMFECFLKYLYCAEVENESFSIVKELYSLAVRYDVRTLKQKCVDIITDSCLQLEQVCEILKMAHDYNDEDLKNAAKFYAAYHIQDIETTAEWNNLITQSPEIAYEVFFSAHYVPE